MMEILRIISYALIYGLGCGGIITALIIAKISDDYPDTIEGIDKALKLLKTARTINMIAIVSNILGLVLLLIIVCTK